MISLNKFGLPTDFLILIIIIVLYIYINTIINKEQESEIILRLNNQGST